MKAHKSPLRFVLFFALMFSANLAIAEESGGFVGLEIGGGASGAESTMISGHNTLETIEFDSGFKPTYYGLVAGYKQFFTHYLGLRYYANINALHFALNPKGCDGNSCDNFGLYGDIAMISYGANIDFMGKFYSSESTDFGGFVGFGLGANSWVGKGLSNHAQQIHSVGSNHSNFALTQTGFDCWVNLGLRANLATHHSIEAVARVPLLKTTLIDVNFDNTEQGATIKRNAKTTIKGIYAVSIRYAINF